MLLLALYALTYFLPFYLSRATRPSPTLPRNAPSVIRARIRFVIVSCSVCTAVTYVVLVREAKTTPADALHLLGYWPLGLLDAFRSLLLTALLFLGPLFSYMIVNSGWREWVRLEPLKEVWNDWTTWRNLVAVRLLPPLFPFSQRTLQHADSTPPARARSPKRSSSAPPRSPSCSSRARAPRRRSSSRR